MLALPGAGAAGAPTSCWSRTTATASSPTPVIRALERRRAALAVNTQNNGANVGYNMITKYRRPNFVCLDESEMRWAAQDKEGPIEEVVRRDGRELWTATA